MKSLARWALFTLLLLSPALAQSLVSLAPTGAVAGFYVGELSNSPYLKGIGEDWRQSGLEAWVRRNLEKELGHNSDLLGLAQGGAFAALYPDGGFFFISKPSARAMQAVRSEIKKARLENGWLVERTADTVSGVSRELVFIAAPKQANLFLSNKRGLRAPISGDLFFWGEPPKNLDLELGLPPRLGLTLASLKRISLGLKLTAGGYTTEARLEIDRTTDPAFSNLLLPREKPWELGDFPAGYSGGVGVLDLPATGRYLSSLLSDLEVKLGFDLRAFGTRYALVTVPGPRSSGVGNLEAPLGHQLVYLEVKDAATAEANFLAAVQNLAAFATPEGQGGFKVAGLEGNFKALEVGLLGNLYYRLDGDKLVIATSRAALEAASGKLWKERPEYRRFRVTVPQNAVAYSFGDQKGPGLESLATLRQSIPQTIGAKDRESKELTNRLMNFLERLYGRLGNGISYSVVEGSTLVSRGFSEVRWR
ncbi:hypothetical protein [Calidithermus roseus]|uniref:DUF3352 domain-containing protein n=1 Tax=Calidithermus roseus TaxID=1644118 RepID=A0A399EUP0_9DEIN|nr:hypothetical protein [Calidithermus roseus]RIH87748.1 hypothetical protein Mrose_01143 [Calidithermus roseus]